MNFSLPNFSRQISSVAESLSRFQSSSNPGTESTETLSEPRDVYTPSTESSNPGTYGPSYRHAPIPRQRLFERPPLQYIKS